MAEMTAGDGSWLLDEIAPDFRLLDVWRLPVSGGRADFERLLGVMTTLDPEAGDSAPARALWWLRLRLGAWLGLDDRTRRQPIPGTNELSLSARLPRNRHGSWRLSGETMASMLGFRPLYRGEFDAAAEISNSTVHGVLHLRWVRDGRSTYHGEMAVYVKPRGLFGAIYMALIEPFRRPVVYPALLRQLEKAWPARVAA